jgi:hypothetical protein
MLIDTSGCTARPQTAAGAAYLRVALDPCGENQPVEFRGIPDGSETDVVVLRMRDDLVIPPPSYGTGSWGLIIFDTPYLVYQQIMVRYRDSDGPPASDTLRWALNGLSVDDVTARATFPNWIRPTVQLVQTLASIPGDPRLNFQGTTPMNFQISMLRPVVLNEFSCDPAANGWSFIRKYRCASKGRTLHLNAPATATQGRVVSGQIGTESSVKIISTGQGVDLTAIVAQVQPCRFTVSPPFAFNALAQQDLNCRQDIIKTGSYDMQRHWNGAHIWNEVEDVRPIFRGDPNNLVATFRMPLLYTNNLGVVGSNTQDLFKYDGFDMNLGWTVTHMDGLSNEATIHMKHRSIWEVNVPGGSPWAANKSAPCPHDSGALSLEKQLAPSMPHSFEAKYNDLGILASMLTKLTSFGKTFLSGGLRTLSADIGRKIVLEDPYAGPSLYGDSGFEPRNRRNGRRKR